MLTLTDEDILQIITMPEAIDSLKKAYGEIAGKSAVNSPRVDLVGLGPESHVAGPGPRAYLLKTMSGMTSRYGSIRFLSENIRWNKAEGDRVRKERERPGKYGPTKGSILLFDRSNGGLLAILGEGVLRNVRVGAAAAIAADYLSARDAGIVGIIGSGFMARAHLHGLSLVRSLELAHVYSPSVTHRDLFAKEMTELLGIKVQPVESFEDAIRGSTIVALTTNSTEPVYGKDNLKRGVHVSCVRHCEIQEETYPAFDKVLLNSKADCRITYRLAGLPEDQRAADFVMRNYQEGYPPGNTFWDSLPDLVDLVSGNALGRENPDETTCFDNSTGFGVQFAAIAGRTYELAVEKGIGSYSTKHWFPGFE